MRARGNITITTYEEGEYLVAVATYTGPQKRQSLGRRKFLLGDTETLKLKLTAWIESVHPKLKSPEGAGS